MKKGNAGIILNKLASPFATVKSNNINPSVAPLTKASDLRTPTDSPQESATILTGPGEADIESVYKIIVKYSAISVPCFINSYYNSFAFVLLDTIVRFNNSNK